MQSGSYIQSYGPRFTYFDRNLGYPDWEGLRVLDFGGNAGNVLKDPNSKISHSNYVCLDVSPSAVEAGKAMFPNALWLLYNRWNAEFNSQGVRMAPIPELGVFDIILACSVFTHTYEEEMIETIKDLRQRCRTLAFTIVTPENSVHFFKQRGVDENRMLQKISGLEKFYYLNQDEIYSAPPSVEAADYFLYFCSFNHIRSLFPDIYIMPLVGTDTQNCCILRGDLG